MASKNYVLYQNRASQTEEERIKEEHEIDKQRHKTNKTKQEITNLPLFSYFFRPMQQTVKSQASFVKSSYPHPIILLWDAVIDCIKPHHPTPHA